MPDRQTIVVAVSGCSSSGKTTLSRLLRDIFPNSFVLHADDFYKPESELPISHGMLDWDCAESLSLPDMIKALEHIHAEGTFPPFLDSKEDQNEIGPCPVPETQIAAQKSLVASWAAPDHSLPRICILDGFLLYPPSMSCIQKYLDLKLFLRTTREKALARRAARSGYVTLEGFWEDPPGYVEAIVWPNYVREHAFLFDGGDVEGPVDEKVAREAGVEFLEEEQEMGRVLEWAVGRVMGLVGEIPRGVEK